MFSRVDLSAGALVGGSRHAFTGGNPISNIAFNGHDWPPTLAGIGGALAVAGVCLAIGVATAGVGAVVCAVVAGLAATLLTNATPATTAQAAPATTATSSETITPPPTIRG